MTNNKGKKAVIRARMARTGESYTAARAQLARERDHVIRDGPVQASQGAGEASQPVMTTPAARRAITASSGATSSAWHLVIAIGATNGIANRVLAQFDEVPRIAAPPAAPQTPAARSWTEAVAAAGRLALRERGGLMDTGILLRAAVSVLTPADLPDDQQPLLAALRDADLGALCSAAWQEFGPEDDDRSEGGQFGRFNEQARVAVVAAQEEARALDHNWIGTEHLLLGVLKERAGLAVQVLTARGIGLDDMRARVLELLGRGEALRTHQIPFTPQAKISLKRALGVSMDLQSNYVGTEHLLIAIVEEGDGVAAQVLREAGCTADKVRRDVLALHPA